MLCSKSEFASRAEVSKSFELILGSSGRLRELYDAYCQLRVTDRDTLEIVVNQLRRSSSVVSSEPLGAGCVHLMPRAAVSDENEVQRWNAELAPALQQCQALTGIHLTGAMLPDKVVHCLLKAIAANSSPSLTQFYFSFHYNQSPTAELLHLIAERHNVTRLELALGALTESQAVQLSTWAVSNSCSFALTLGCEQSIEASAAPSILYKRLLAAPHLTELTWLPPLASPSEFVSALTACSSLVGLVGLLRCFLLCCQLFWFSHSFLVFRTSNHASCPQHSSTHCSQHCLQLWCRCTSEGMCFVSTT